MDSFLPKPKKKKKFCCFAQSDSSGDESVITIDRESIFPFEPVIQKRYLINNYASDRVYLIPTPGEYFVLTVKQILLESKTPLGSQIQSSRQFKRSMQAVSSILQTKDESFEVSDRFLSEKIQKKLCKLLISRQPATNSLVSTRRNCSLALHLAKYCHVVLLEQEKVLEELVHNNPDFSFQGFKINFIEGTLDEYQSPQEFDLLVFNLVEKDQEDQESTEEVLKSFSKTVQKYSNLIQNIAVVLPFATDPVKICEQLSCFSVSPSVEVLVYSDLNPSKYQIVLLGQLVKPSTSELVQNLLSRLALPQTQFSSIREIIEKLGIRGTLKLLQESEKQVQKAGRDLAQSFLEKAKTSGCSLKSVKTLHIGPDCHRLLKVSKSLQEFFLVYSTEGSSVLQDDTRRITGELEILRYLEESQDNDMQNNSLLGLVEG